MAGEETYELRLEPEGFHIIPMSGEEGGEELAVLLPGEHGKEGELFISSEEVGKKEELVIQYGNSWFQDLLSSLFCLSSRPSLLDFPVFCSSGLGWSNRVILASLAPHLASILQQEDVCLILPDISLQSFQAFHAHLFSCSPLSSSLQKEVARVGVIFGLDPLALGTTTLPHTSPAFLDYQQTLARYCSSLSSPFP